jgi:hypothetical protein
MAHGLTTCLDGTPERLTKRMEMLIDLLVVGDPQDGDQQAPLTPYEAGQRVGVSRKYMRALLTLDCLNKALEEKRRLLARDGYLPTLLPTVEHLRDQIRWQEERAKLRDRIKELELLLDSKRREMAEHYMHCPKHPKPAKSGAGYRIILDRDEDAA